MKKFLDGFEGSSLTAAIHPFSKWVEFYSSNQDSESFERYAVYKAKLEDFLKDSRAHAEPVILFLDKQTFEYLQTPASPFQVDLDHPRELVVRTMDQRTTMLPLGIEDALFSYLKDAGIKEVKIAGEKVWKKCVIPPIATYGCVGGITNKFLMAGFSIRPLHDLCYPSDSISTDGFTINPNVLAWVQAFQTKEVITYEDVLPALREELETSAKLRDFEIGVYKTMKRLGF